MAKQVERTGMHRDDCFDGFFHFWGFGIRRLISVFRGLSIRSGRRHQQRPQGYLAWTEGEDLADQGQGIQAHRLRQGHCQGSCWVRLNTIARFWLEVLFFLFSLSEYILHVGVKLVQEDSWSAWVKSLEVKVVRQIYWEITIVSMRRDKW